MEFGQVVAVEAGKGIPPGGRNEVVDSSYISVAGSIEERDCRVER